MAKNREFQVEEYLLCPDGSRRPLSELTEAEYAAFCRRLSLEWHRALFAGLAEFPDPPGPAEPDEARACLRPSKKEK